ncbi:MAG: hypothetical protein JOZ26_21215, partial [Hyphomicrobiales bacterium]|nr:hypothetical protein [Hyphomicrobiales bacterium]
MFDRIAAERFSGLVEDEQAQIVGDCRTRYFDHLTVGERQVVEMVGGADPAARKNFGQPGRGALRRGTTPAPAGHPAAARQIDVFRDGQFKGQR